MNEKETDMKKLAVFVILALTAIPAFAQSRQIEGPLVVTVGETVVFRYAYPRTWSVTPSESFHLLGSSSGNSITIRVVSMPRGGRARVSNRDQLFGIVRSFYFDVVEAAAVPAPAPIAPAIPPNNSDAPATLTRTQALQFVRGLSMNEIKIILASLAFGLEHLTAPAAEANSAELIIALKEEHGEGAVFAALLRLDMLGDALAMLLLLENESFVREIVELVNR